MSEHLPGYIINPNIRPKKIQKDRFSTLKNGCINLNIFNLTIFYATFIINT